MAELTKGSIFVRERGLLYPFMFNPAEIEESKAMNYPNETPAGGSNPIYNFASGGERLITFTLYLDGDRGRSDQRPRGADSVQALGGLNQIATFTRTPVTDTASGGAIPLSVLSEVRLLQSLLYPSQYGKTATEVYPYLCIFTFGGTYPAIPVIVKKADPKYTFFTDKLDPVRASVAMQLAIIRPSYETAAEYQASSQENAQTAQNAQGAINAGIGALPAGIASGVGSLLGGAGGAFVGAIPNLVSSFRR